MRTLSYRLLASVIALAMTAPGPALAQAVTRVSLPGQARLGVVIAAPLLGTPSGAAPALLLAPASLTPSLFAAPAMTPAPLAAAVPVALQPVLPAAAKPALDRAAVQTAKLTPQSGASQSKEAAGKAFEGTAQRRAPAAEVAGSESAGAPALDRAEAPAPSFKSVPPIPVSQPTIVSRVRNAWPTLLGLGVAAVSAFILYKFGSPAAGLMPFLGLAGTLGWTPSGGVQAAFMAAIRSAAAPGTVISYTKVGEIGTRLGLDSDKSGASFTGLLEEGHLAIRDNKDVLHFTFKSRTQSPHDRSEPERSADALALEAVLKMNSGAPIDHAISVAKADRAVALYEQIARTSGRPVHQIEEARVLRANATLEFTSSLLRAHLKDLESRQSLPLALVQRAADVAETLEWLKTATYQIGHVPPMPERIHKKIVALIGSLNPATEGSAYAAGDIADGYIAALDLLETYDPRDFLYEGLPNKNSLRARTWSPDPSQRDRFLAEVQGRTEAGTTITRETLIRAGRELNLDSAQINAVIEDLATFGRLILRANGASVLIDFHERAMEDADGMAQTHGEALEAIKILNLPGIQAHLRAVARLDALHQEYFEAAKKRHGAAKDYNQVLIALANAKLEVAEDVLAEAERRLRAQPVETTSTPLETVLKARAWLSTAHYSMERRQSVSADVHRALTSSLTLSAVRDALDGKADPELTRGVILTKKFFMELTADRADGADAGSPAPHPSGWRPLDAREFPALTKYGIDLTGKALEGK